MIFNYLSLLLINSLLILPSGYSNNISNIENNIDNNNVSDIATLIFYITMLNINLGQNYLKIMIANPDLLLIGTNQLC